jgi:hypothetical protein
LTVAPGQVSAAIPLSDSPLTLQVFKAAGGPGLIASFTVSTIGGPDTRVVGQALLGQTL